MINLIFLTLTASNVVVYGQSKNNAPLIFTTKKPAFFNIDSYKDKICKSEPTCNLIYDTPKDLIPKELTTLQNRNCMCDADCAEYGDCCVDSKYYKEAEQKENFQKYHCSLLERVYMKTNCPASYKKEDIKRKCEKSVSPLESEDKKLIVPVTNVKTRITYGNEYCAQCHGVKEYQPWNLTSYCSAALKEFAEHDDFKQNYPLANLENDTAPMALKSPAYRAENFADLTENSTLPQSLNDLFTESEEASKFIKFDPSTRTFYSVYKEKNFTCSYGRITPKSLEPYLRPCEPFVAECPNFGDQAFVRKCQSYTSIVFDNFGAYKNKDCAACNGVVKKLPGCFSLSVVNGGAASSLFSPVKANGANPCDSAALKDKFC